MDGRQERLRLNDEQVASVIRKLVERGFLHSSNHPATQSDDSREEKFWLKIVAGILTMVAGTGIVGGIAMYGRMSAMETKVDNLQYEVNELRAALAPRYRDDAPPARK